MSIRVFHKAALRGGFSDVYNPSLVSDNKEVVANRPLTHVNFGARIKMALALGRL